eukprot:758259-Prymnesium_polylepis.1
MTVTTTVFYNRTLHTSHYSNLATPLACAKKSCEAWPQGPAAGLQSVLTLLHVGQKLQPPAPHTIAAMHQHTVSLHAHASPTQRYHPSARFVTSSQLFGQKSSV